MATIINKTKNNFEIKDIKDGFTIIETLVAITILMIAIVGPLTIAHRGLSGAVIAREQVVASYLAQDAIESIKMIKINNVLDGIDLDANGSQLRNCIDLTGNNHCYISIVPTGSGNGNQDINISVGTCNITDNSCLLYVHPDNGYVNSSQNGAVATRYKRGFVIEEGDVTDVDGKIRQYRVKVRVDWMSGTIPNSTVFESYLFDYEL